MNTIATGTAAVLLAAALGLLAGPASAQQASNAVCTGDYICIDTTVVQTWPLERWSQVRRQTKQETATARPGTSKAVTR